MANMISDRRPDPFEKLFLNQRPVYKDPKSIPINIKETAKTYVIEAALPGLSKDNIRVNVNGDVLAIYVPTEEEKATEGKQEGAKGQKPSQQAAAQAKQETPESKYHRREIVKIFRPRPIRLPQDANTEDVKAEYTDGILTIIIKRDPVKGKKHEIQVQ